MTDDDSDTFPENYTDNSPFVRVFADPARVRVLDVLLSRGTLALSAERLSELASVSGDSLDTHLDVLESAGLLAESAEGRYRIADTEVAEFLCDHHLNLHDRTESIVTATGGYE